MSHVYGPHRPADNPQTVTVWGRWGEPTEVPYPAALAAQRAAINRIASAAPIADVTGVTSARGDRP